MELRCPAPALPLLLLLLAGLTAPLAAAAAAAAPSDQTRLQLDGVDYRAEILTEVDRMNVLLGNMTRDLTEATQPTPAPAPAPEDEEGDDTDPDTGLEHDPVALTLNLLPHGQVLSKRSGQPPPSLPGRLALERQEALPAEDIKVCVKDDVNKALSDSTVVLDRVSAGEFTPDVLTDLESQNDALNGFFPPICSLASMGSDVANELLDNVVTVQTHAEVAKDAATPAEIGLLISSAYMVVLITLCCLMALGALVGLAVLAFRYTSTSTTTTTSGGGGGGGGGGRDAQAGRPKRAAGQPNPAFQRTEPPGSLHQARNERWQRPSNAELESSHRPPAASNSTLGRMWGGVVRAYQRSRDSVAESTNDGGRGYPTDEPRREPRAATPPQRYSPRPSRRASPPPRRASPPPRRASPPPRRAAPPPRRNSPPPPRRNSPPPRPYSPPPQPAGGDNWAYGPTGRSKSTDSPFASAW